MIDRSEVERVKAHLADPREVAGRLGLTRGKTAPQGGGGILVCCPARSEKTPSCSLTRGPDGTLRVKCHGCGFAGDVFDLVAAVENVDRNRHFREVLERAASLAGIHLDDRPGEQRPALPPPKWEPPPPEPPKRPPEAELRALLDACGPCARDPEVAAWLQGRALDATAIDRYGLAFALPRGTRVPRWASYKGDREQAAPWPELGYRLIVPMRDAEGKIASVRARAVGTMPEGMPKALPATGFDAHELVMACPLGALMLACGVWPAGVEGRVVISEGEPDFWTWASRGTGPRTIAALGIGGNGQWTEAIADRIPSGSVVILRTDQDDAGDRYAEQITRTLRGRCAVLESGAEERAERRRTRPERERAKREAERQARRNATP